MPFDEVLSLARDGDVRGLSEVWRRYAPSVAGFVRSRGCAEPDEVTSDTFLAVFRTLPRFVGGEPEFRGLLFTIARRRVVDELRSRARRPDVVPFAPERDRRIAASAEQEVLVDAGERRARELVEALVPDQRDVLLMRIFGDLTVEQVALALGKSPGAVKALQRRGLEALRRSWAGNRDEEVG